MIRRFNYTNRIKIPRDRVDIKLLKDTIGQYFKAKIDLSGLNFYPDAKVYIEANYAGVYQRFSFGTVQNIVEPENTHLTELPDTQITYFDISVVDESSLVGLLLGKTRGITICTDDLPNDRMPLLYVNPTDLRNQFWRLNFFASEEGRPILEVNNRITDIAQRAKTDPNFISLVYPIALRLILTKVILEGDEDINSDHWTSDWQRFVQKILGKDKYPISDDENHTLTSDQEAWVDDCVNEYCKKFQLFEKFTEL